MNKSIIDEIFHEPVSRIEKCVPTNKEYRALSGIIDQKEQALLQNLSEENRKLFESYMDSKMDQFSMEMDEAYRQGVSLGVRIVSEAFVLGKEEA